MSLPYECECGARLTYPDGQDLTSEQCPICRRAIATGPASVTIEVSAGVMASDSKRLHMTFRVSSQRRATVELFIHDMRSRSSGTLMSLGEQEYQRLKAMIRTLDAAIASCREQGRCDELTGP